jgi:hypothetical protein
MDDSLPHTKQRRTIAVLACVTAVCFATALLGYILRTARNERMVNKALRAPYSPQTWDTLEQRLDSNSILPLAQALDTNVAAIDRAYGWAWSNMPVTISSNLPQPLNSATRSEVRARASAFLASPSIGQHVSPAIIVKELQDPMWQIRMNGLACLNNSVLPSSGSDGLGEYKREILSLVVSAAADSKMPVRMSAVYCLGYFTEATNTVIPVLSNAFTDTSPDVRIRAALAFHRLDPVMAKRAGSLSVARDCLSSDGPHGSKYLAMKFLEEQHELPPRAEH